MTGPAARRRLFVGLAPPPAAQAELASAAAALGHGGRAVPAANLHLTLAFLGSIEDGPAQAVEQALAGVRGEPFTLALSKVGHFPRPRVLWCAAVPAPGALYALQGAVAKALAGAGVELESRPFAPHVTVARKVARYRGPAALPSPVAWPLDAFRLVASVTRPAGAEHRTVRAFGLHG